MKKVLKYSIRCITAIFIFLALKKDFEVETIIQTVLLTVYFVGLSKIPYLQPKNSHEKYLSTFICAIGGLLVLLFIGIYAVLEQRDSGLIYCMATFLFIVGLLHIRYTLFLTGVYILIHLIFEGGDVRYMLQSLCMGVVVAVISLLLKKIGNSSFQKNKNYLRIVK